MGNVNRRCEWPQCSCDTRNNDPCRFEDPDFYIAKAERAAAAKPSAAPPPDAARQEGEDKHPLYVLRQFDAMDPVGSEASHFIMAAPLRVIKAVLSLHNDAVQRATRETAGGGRCTLHRSSASPIWGGAWHFTITKKVS